MSNLPSTDSLQRQTLTQSPSFEQPIENASSPPSSEGSKRESRATSKNPNVVTLNAFSRIRRKTWSTWIVT
jgi:hypothetical protein